MKKPELGRRVRYVHPLTEVVWEGEVVMLLSAQFMLDLGNGRVKLVLFREDWEYINDTRSET